MRPDGHDVRVTLADGETLLPHVIEKDLGTTAMLLWTRAPFLPEGTSELFLHHGNPTAERRESVSDVFVPGIVVNPAWTSEGVSTLHVDLEQQTFPAGTDHVVRFDIRIVALSGTSSPPPSPSQIPAVVT